MEVDVVCTKCKMKVMKPARTKVNGKWKYVTPEYDASPNGIFVQHALATIQPGSQVPGASAQPSIPNPPFNPSRTASEEYMDTDDSNHHGINVDEYGSKPIRRVV
jgi:hypothetical protein